MRIATLKLEGKIYPLIFSLYAAEKIEDECIPIDDMTDCFLNPKKYMKNSIRLVKDIIWIMLREGILYCKRKEIKEIDNMKLELDIPEYDEFYVDVSYDDFGNFMEALYNTLIKSKKNESGTKQEKEVKQ